MAKAKRRGHGEGSITQLKDGRWRGVIVIGYDDRGKPIRKDFSRKTQKEAVKQLNIYREQKERGTIREPNKLHVAEWLDIWHKKYAANKVKITTRTEDECVIRNHLKPNIGRIKLSELKSSDIQIMYNKLLHNGRTDGKGGLTAKTIGNIHIILRRAIKQALKDHLIYIDPLLGVQLPKEEQKEIETFNKDEQTKLLAACKKSNNSWSKVVVLGLFTGMRLGEIIGLTWDKIDFDRNEIKITAQAGRYKKFGDKKGNKTELRVREETKTKSSRRIIKMSSIVQELLTKHKTEQEKSRKYFDAENKSLNLVFSRTDGGIIDPSTFRDFYKNLLELAEIEHKTFHALRHTFVTNGLHAGANMKVISKIVGHSNIKITYDIYSHVSQDLQEETMELVANF